MFFDEQKTSKDKVSFHLIIDEAHNILSDQSRNDNTSWKDYRLSTFEEIIKEGRKFGFSLLYQVKDQRIFHPHFSHKFIISFYTS